MLNWKYSLLTAAVLGCVAPAQLMAQGAPKAAAEEKTEGQGVKTDLSTRVPSVCRANRVNFNKELGLPLDYLGSVGQRIRDARISPDPVELALAAQSLEVAETVSGKKASVTAAEVQAEAVNLAKQRGNSAELASVALIVKDDAIAKELKKEAAAAQKREKDNAAALASGETTRQIYGIVRVDNHSQECIKVYIDGTFMGTVHNGQTGRFSVRAPNHSNSLVAICEDGHLVSSEVVNGHHHAWYWHIH